MVESDILCDPIPIYDAGSHCASAWTGIAGECIVDVSDTAFLGDSILFAALYTLPDSTEKYDYRRRLKC